LLLLVEVLAAVAFGFAVAAAAVALVAAVAAAVAVGASTIMKRRTERHYTSANVKCTSRADVPALAALYCYHE
jgi:hypothetical protein